MKILSSLTSINKFILTIEIIFFTTTITLIAIAVQSLDIQAIYSVIQTCLKPPYLYLLINLIILTIAFTSSSHFHSQNTETNHNSDHQTNNVQVALNGLAMSSDMTSSWNPLPQQIITTDLKSEEIEKPLVASRFAHRKQPVKTSPTDGNKALKVARPKKQETLESTWKKMTDGRHVPLTRHLRKSETIENHHHSEVYCLESPEQMAKKKNKVMKKSVTLKDRTNYDNENHQPPPQTTSSPASSGKKRKEGALSHDELNRRIEAFIKKFNDDMRLQRQEESVKQYKK